MACNAQIIADEVAEWSNRNRVKLNIDKCKELRISFAAVSREFPPVVIGGECIKAVSDAKLLGVTIFKRPILERAYHRSDKEGSQKALFSYPA